MLSLQLFIGIQNVRAPQIVVNVLCWCSSLGIWEATTTIGKYMYHVGAARIRRNYNNAKGVSTQSTSGSLYLNHSTFFRRFSAQRRHGSLSGTLRPGALETRVQRHLQGRNRHRRGYIQEIETRGKIRRREVSEHWGMPVQDETWKINTRILRGKLCPKFQSKRSWLLR